ncbi:MAG: acetate kinase [Prevotellaceae bacterium]|jgi:acetate kinase|nr:acetate kinase [Prevotellaceae bacterium]
MKILVLNCGSSSIKYQVFDMLYGNSENRILAKGIVERIGLQVSKIVHKSTGKENAEFNEAVRNHVTGINKILDLLVSDEHGIMQSLDEISAVGHRVAHGGDYFTESALIDEAAERKIEEYVELAPLHNPANLNGIRAIRQILPNVPQVACFDTSFHQTMPPHSYLYALPYDYFSKLKIRRYGFHGMSHKFVSHKVCNELGCSIENTKIITCHLGNGSSITAVDRGKSIDTTMGFTPLEGLMMGTRCGDIDAGIILYLLQSKNLTGDQINSLLNKESGLYGISGISSDMRDLWNAADKGNKQAKLALDMFMYRVLKYIGAYAAAMNGVDVIVFTGGIGENDFSVREAVSKKLEYLGVDFDSSVNNMLRGVDFKVITKPGSKVKVVVASTDEELVIATDTMRLTNNKQ